jgi:membrane fusion protein (multidrug efflux system)
MRFDSGDRVVKGQVLVELSSVEQYADLAESKATLEAARRNYERFQELAKRGFAATQRLEAARAAFESAQARTAGLQARIADRVIRAPFSGVIGLREASPGALAEVGMRLGTLDDTSRIKLDFDVAENQIAGLRPGASVIARTPAYPNETFTGVIANVNSRIDLNTRTLKARAILPNKNGRLKPGMLMSVEVRLNPRRSLAVPEMAVLERDTGTTLYVLEEAGGKTLAKLTDVVVGDRAEGWAEITTGVAEGQRIIAEGVHRVRPDQPVKVEQETARVPAGQAPPAEGGLRGPARAS